MTKTATKKAKTETAAPIVAGEGFKELGRGEYKLADIEISFNFRKTFNEKALRAYREQQKAGKKAKPAQEDEE